MPTITGTVEGVSRKFGKFSILVNDAWYGTKAEWAPDPAPNKGDTVEFYTQDGKKYLQNCQILERAEGGYSEPAPRLGSTEAAPKNKDEYLAGISVGAALNQACNLLSSSKDIPDMDTVRALAIDLYKLADELKANVTAGDIEVDAREQLSRAEEAEARLKEVMSQKFAE